MKMENSKKYKTELAYSFISSLVLILLLGKSIRNYIPIIFGAVGFVRFAMLSWNKYYFLSERLVEKFKPLLIQYGIHYRQRGKMYSVNIFDLIGERKKMISSEKSLKNDLNEFNILINLTLISFFGIILLGILTVILA